MPLPPLRYARVVTTMRRRRVVDVKHRVVLGAREAVDQGRAVCGWPINTAFVERIHLSLCQHVAAIGRRTPTLCTGADGVRRQLAVYHGY